MLVWLMHTSTSCTHQPPAHINLLFVDSEAWWCLYEVHRYACMFVPQPALLANVRFLLAPLHLHTTAQSNQSEPIHVAASHHITYTSMESASLLGCVLRFACLLILHHAVQLIHMNSHKSQGPCPKQSSKEIDYGSNDGQRNAMKAKSIQQPTNLFKENTLPDAPGFDWSGWRCCP
jgi:hypothetical protein